MERIRKNISLYYDSTVDFISNSLSDIGTKEGFKKYLKNTGWLFIGKISGMIASFFVGVYVARYLGPSQYGLLSYAVSFAGLFSIFTSLGIDSILNRELVSHPEEKDELLGSGFMIKIIGSIIAIMSIVISLFFIKTDILTNTLILISASTFIFSAFGVIDIYFQSQVLAKNTVKIQIMSLIITTILKLLFIFLNFGIIYFAIVYLIDIFIISIGFVLSYKKTGQKIFKWKVKKDLIIMLLKNSWPMILSGAAITIYMKIDQVMITNMLGNEANGLYSVAVKLSEVWYFIPALICSSIFPSIVQAKKGNPIMYENRLKKLYSLMFYLSVSIAIIISSFSGIIITSLFGNEYLGAINVLKIHIWAGVGVFIGYALSQYMIIENYTKIFLYTTIIGAIINIILNIILIPKIGIVGAAIATAVSYILQSLSIIFFKKTKNQLKILLKSIFLLKNEKNI